MNLFPFVLAFANGDSPNPLVQFVPIIVIFGIFYLLLIAPMRKRQKKLQTLQDELKKGDRVVTNGGIYGEVAGVEGNALYLKIADKVKIRVLKSSIAGLEGSDDQEVNK